MKNLFAKIGLSMMALALFVGITLPASAALPSATSTVDAIGTVVINTVVSWLIYFFTNYFSWIIGVIILGIIVGVGYKMLHKSTAGSK